MLFPQLNRARELISLNGIWNFLLGSTELDASLAQHPLPHAETMAVPGSYNDQKADAAHRDHYGYAYYQRRVQLPQRLIASQERIVLRFGSVSSSAPIKGDSCLLRST